MKKKIFGVMIVGCLILTMILLTGCGNKEKNDEVSNEPEKIRNEENITNESISNNENESQTNSTESDFDETNGKDVMNAMTQTQKDSFNAQFTTYEGKTLKGAQIKSLLSQVRSSNLANSEKVTVDYNGEEASETEDINNMSSKIVTAMTYNVSLEYEEGLVKKIVIN